jgi:hypothetical protein
MHRDEIASSLRTVADRHAAGDALRLQAAATP